MLFGDIGQLSIAGSEFYADECDYPDTKLGGYELGSPHMSASHPAQSLASGGKDRGGMRHLQTFNPLRKADIEPPSREPQQAIGAWRALTGH